MPGQRAALYVRVSTTDGRQHTQNQLRALEDYAKRHKFQIAQKYVDRSSGSRGAGPGGRGELARLLRDAHQGLFDIVLVFALDRLTREGVFKAFQYIERLKTSGVDFRSITEEHINTAGAAGEMFLSIAAALARLEREKIRSRINAGLARAREQGTQLGRPAAAVDMSQLRRLRRLKRTIEEIMKITGHSRATIYRRLNPKKEPKP